jgi:hypothetical protein
MTVPAKERKNPPDTLLKTHFVFRKKRGSEKVANARGIIFRLKEPEAKDEAKPDFKAEARQLITCLTLIFPRETLINMKKMLPDS